VLILPPPILADITQLYEFAGDAEAMRYTHVDTSLRDCRRRVVLHEWRRRRHGYAPWAILSKADGRIIGWGACMTIPSIPAGGLRSATSFIPAPGDRCAVQNIGQCHLRLCLGWTERRFHLGGGVACAILRHLLEQECAICSARICVAGGERSLTVTPKGIAWFADPGSKPRPAAAPLAHALRICRAPYRLSRDDKKKSRRLLAESVPCS
jgi:hypothetical protein